MKLNYDAPKHARINHRFLGVCSHERDLWYVESLDKWLPSDEIPEWLGFGSHCDVGSDKAFRRKLGKWSRQLGRRVKFTLVSRFVGCDVNGFTEGGE